MAENYKHLYEQMKKMVTMYQDEIVPRMRKQIEDLEQNQIKVRCKDCKHWVTYFDCCNKKHITMHEDDFCSFGKRREGE